MHKKTFFRFALLPVVLFISGCNSPDATPTAAPLIPPTDTLRPTESVTTTGEPQLPTATYSDPGPPTEAPPPTPETGPVPTLAAGSNLEIVEIEMIDEVLGWAIGGVDAGRDRVLYTRDGGATFQDVTPPIGPMLSSGTEMWVVGAFIDREHARLLYFPAVLEPAPPGGAEVVIWTTDDAGSTWSHGGVISASVLGTQDFPPRLHFVDQHLGWFMARNGGAGMHRYPISLYRTENAGATWDLLIDAMGGSGLQSCWKTDWAFGDAMNGIATIDNCPVDGPVIERTTDGGLTWARVTLPAPQEDPQSVTAAYCRTYSVQFITAELVVLSASCTGYEDPQVERQIFYRSSDAGQNWVAWDFPGGQVHFLDETHGFTLSRDIFWSADGGATWEPRKTVNWDGQFSFVDPSTGWAVARAGDQLALVVTRDGAESWQIIEPRVGP